MLYGNIKDCKNFNILKTRSIKNFTSSYYALTVILNSKSKKERDNLILKLKKNGIQTSIYYPHPVPMLNYYRKKYNFKSSEFLNSKKIAYNSISFPIAPHVKSKDIQYISSVIKNLIG